MGNRFPWVFLAAVVSLLMQVSGGPSSYKAAVVEFHPSFEKNEAKRVEANVKDYIKLMAKAKAKGAQIIVFPENGLGTKETRSYIPDPAEKVVPCNSTDPKLNKVIKDLSCASIINSIYSIINLVEKRYCDPDDEYCPSKQFYVFNSNVVFDRKGMVIARYAKYNLFDEPFTDSPHDPEMSFFDTDFGVRFGTFTCFDILFSTPAQRLIQQYHITDFVFPTFWFSELPFLTALQAQTGWAEANNVNLLASGVNNPSTGSGGSGIYNGKFGHIVQIMSEFVRTKLLVADVPKLQERSYTDVCQKENSTFSGLLKTSTRSERATDDGSITVTAEQGLQLLKDQINSYTSQVIEGGTTFDKTVCSSNNFCCHFEVTMDALSPGSQNYTCRAVVFNGVRWFGKTFRGGVQSCGVVMCNGPDIKNCTNRLGDIWGLFKFKKIEIKGNFNLRNSFQMPSTLTAGKELKPLPANKYVFKRAEKEGSAEVSLELVWPVVDLQTFAIWGRDFTRDGEPKVPESGASVMSAPTLLLSLVAFILFLH